MEPEGGQCFICRSPTNLTSFSGQKEWAAFDLLCDLLDTPWVRKLDVVKPRNSDFCEPCELHIQDALKIQNEIKSLKLKLLEHKFDLQTKIQQTYHHRRDANGDVGRSSLLTLGRMLSQCWSRCKVVIYRQQVNSVNSEEEIMITAQELAVKDQAETNGEESGQDPESSGTILVDSEWFPSEESEVDEAPINSTLNSMQSNDQTTRSLQTPITAGPSDGPLKKITRRKRIKRSRQLEDPDLSTTKFTCNECCKSFKAQSTLRFHRLRHHNKDKKCEICEIDFDDYIKLKAHLRRHGSDPVYACDTCDNDQLLFHTASAVRQHYSDHHPDSPIIFTCSTCRHSCPTPEELFYHQNSSHAVPSTRDYLCQDCGKSYSKLSNLTSHQKFRHLGIPRKRRSLQCDQCGKIFPEMWRLKYHILDVHERGSKPCPICKRNSKAVTHLKSHIIRTHGENWKDWIDSHWRMAQGGSK